MNKLVIATLALSMCFLPASVFAQKTINGRAVFSDPSDSLNRSHSWDDPKNRPIDARGVDTKSKSTGATETRKNDTHGRTPPIATPKNTNMHGTYGIAK